MTMVDCLSYSVSDELSLTLDVNCMDVKCHMDNNKQQRKVANPIITIVLVLQ